MEIKIRIPLKNKMEKIRLKVDESVFKLDLISFINKLENENQRDSELERKLLEYGINQNEFQSMIREVQIFASYDDNKESIGFPYENWIDRLLEIYEE